jgi:putative ABC transport system permease protein
VFEDVVNMAVRVKALTRWRLIQHSLVYFWRSHLAVAMGIAAATAVIVGALVVGDSMRGSLRGLVLHRLSNIECLLHSRTLFDIELLETLSTPQDSSTAATSSIVPAIILSSATVESKRDGTLLRASQVQTLAVESNFFSKMLPEVGSAFPDSLDEDHVAINASLAIELGVAVGDELTMRIGKTSGVPAENPLGRRDQTSQSVPRQKVVAIIPDAGIGGLSFFSGQAVPRNVFASLSTIQDILECDGKANAALVLSSQPSQTVNYIGQNWCDELNLELRPKIDDYGLKLEHHRRVFPDPDIDTTEGNPEPKLIHDYFQISSDELILDKVTSDALVSHLESFSAKPVITYLANSIAKVAPRFLDMSPDRTLAAQLAAARGGLGGRAPGSGINVPFPVFEATDNVAEDTQLLSREVPYSILVGIDSSSQFDLEQYTALDENTIRTPYVWINSWLAEQIDAKPGDWIEVEYFEPETIEGKEVEASARFMVVGIVPITEPVRPYRRNQQAAFGRAPTLFNDPDLTPTVPGVTDQDSISNWDLPFELKREIPEIDDDYWKNHRLTPKLFVPYLYASSRKLFGSRFGDTTAIRIDATEVADEAELRAEIEDALLMTRANKGLAFSPIRQIQLQAASGSTPFDMLFLSLSFFVIVAALLLVALLFKLGIQSRTKQLGMFAAQGFSANHIRSTLLGELSIVAALGAFIGILLGLSYAKLLIAGLESWWVGAISNRFLEFSFTRLSLFIGAAAGMLTSLLTIYASLRKLSRARPLPMLRGEDPDIKRLNRGAIQISLLAACVATIAALCLLYMGLGQTGMLRAGSFFGSGMLLLTASLIAVRQWIDQGLRVARGNSRGSLLELALRSIGRNPVRSSLSLGLLAVASFLIASMSVFQVSPSERGYGGFNLIAQSSQPIILNIASSKVRTEMIGKDAAELASTTIIPMRVKAGEDASCNNLFQVTQPTVLGVSELLQESFDLAPGAPRFEWSATKDKLHPWQALQTSGSGSAENPIPVILDQNTAAWSLKQGGSLGAVFWLNYGQYSVHFKTVGLLSNSVLQGKLIIGEKNFQALFPQESGHSFFLVRSGPKVPEATVAAALENGWSDVGLDVTSSKETLARLLGVQNTYISAFQSLGALGLLLGTFGLIAVQIRSVNERRSELALMQAIGFSSSRIAKMLTIETALLLVGGLVIGILCSAVALVPFLIEAGPQLTLITPLLMLFVVLAAGLVAAIIAVQVATRQPLLASLRAE